MSQELLIYPEGEEDAVTITERDMEELQPGKFLGYNIVDFYIRYLESGLSPEHGKLFYFFNSRFFTKLLGNSKATSIDPCKVDYEQLRGWTKKVNLFEKDFVFIPIVKSSHWSLVIICHLNSLTRPPRNTRRCPCVFHLDPIKGKHESFEVLIRSFIIQAWMERFQPSSDSDQLLALCQVKYVEAEVPRQRNSYDCGLYVLNYIEAFLKESTSSDFRFTSNDRCPDILSPQFVPEVSGKRKHIQELIHELQNRVHEPADGRHVEYIVEQQICLDDTIFDEQQYLEPFTDLSEGVKENSKPGKKMTDGETSVLLSCVHEPADDRHVEYQRVPESFSDEQQHLEPKAMPFTDLSEGVKENSKPGKKMTDGETSVLLSCMLKGGSFHKGPYTHWNLISEEIEKQLGSRPSAIQCRRRYDTLLKAYKECKEFCKRTSKSFSVIKEEGQLPSKLATTLSLEWYTNMDEIDTRKELLKGTKQTARDEICTQKKPQEKPQEKPQKRRKLSSKVVSDSACGTVEIALRNVDPLSVLSSLNVDLQSTLLNLIQECSLKKIRKSWRKIYFDLALVCRKLGILQDREPLEILNYVYQLYQLDFVNLPAMVVNKKVDGWCIDDCVGKRGFFNVRLYEDISKEVFCKNPHLKTYCVSFPIEQSSRQYIKVLSLFEYQELEHLDLRGFHSLRFLAVECCPQLTSVTGWEDAVGLKSIEIVACYDYSDVPIVRCLSSLREISVWGRNFNDSMIRWQFSEFSQCAQLRKLEIQYDKGLLEIVDLENLKELKWLDYLSLRGCPFSSIQGLSGLQALTRLDLSSCKGLRRVPDLGSLKGLTRLDLSFTSVEDVEGVEELHLLIELNLLGCKSLERLPFLGHLTALVCLYLRGTSVKEVPGREDLISLRILIGDVK